MILCFALAALIGAPAPRPQQSTAPMAESRAADETAIKRLGSAWQAAWNARDAAGLAAIMDPQIVFVSVLGPDTPGFGRGGREAFRAAHAAVLASPMFAESRWVTRDVTVVRWLTPDVAVAHVVWETTGDRVRHLAPGTPRRRLFTWVVQRQAGEWRVTASQNTEAPPPLPGR
ncbi:conserved hypothetical protein [Sphingomonas guangdongensis]|uniref:DUF4440 domain-containing protein n=1 Tax=Sphingomonas guangdongensis TaxID=1141890 RepID=A0A285QM88_9SPHN|nr:SgcJ/EcaC family oxidoreductase [Sphingomonas guangdongensis]SOB81202.1 conserved hypothetical protein [Sphingomonas guangdongensis]